MQTKRKNSGRAGDAGSTAQKRRKGNAGAKVKPAASAAKRRVVSINEQAWKPVQKPAADGSEGFGMDGFLGFEELTGFDVVRDGNMIQFVATDAADTVVEKADEASEVNETEFEGFDDDDDDDKTEESKTETSPAKAGPKKDAKDKNKKKDAASKDTQQSKTATKADSKAAAKADADKDKKTQKKEKAAKKTAEPVVDDELSKGAGFAALPDDVDMDAIEDGGDVAAWVPLNLSPPLLSCLARLKFTTPTDIQAAAIPEILAGHDVIGKASTGSGKTLAFGIPIVQRWIARNNSRNAAKKKKAANGGASNDDDNNNSSNAPKMAPMALVLTPTRELAHQIYKHIKELCTALPTSPYVCPVTGGMSVQKQQRELERADIVVATPGRLWEVMNLGPEFLEAFQGISFIIIDEADRLLADGHFKEAKEIVDALERVDTQQDGYEEEAGGDDEDDEGPKRRPRQTLVFSATFNKGLQQKLAGKSRYDLMDESQSMEHLLKQLNFREEVPKFIDVNPVSQMAGRLRERLLQCDAMEKVFSQHIA